MQYPKLHDIADLAQESTEILCSDDRTLAVLLFGSTARGEADANSDLDLLVLYRDQVPEETLDEIDERVSVCFYDRERFWALPSRSPLFAVHLAREGRPMHDPQGELHEALAAIGPVKRSGRMQLARWTLQKLARVLADPEYAPDDVLSAGQLYALSKQAALLASAAEGVYEFDRKRAFAHVASAGSALRGDMKQVALLEPAWLSARPNVGFGATGLQALDEDVASAAVRVIDQLVHASA